MHTYHDSHNRTWTIDLTVGSAKRVLAECGVDLIASADDDWADSLVTNSLESLVRSLYLLGDVLWSFSCAQAQRDFISRDDFFDSLDADALQNAADALIAEVINFSRPANRKLMAALFRNAQTLAGELDRAISETLETPEMKRKIRELLANSACCTPASSASAPTDSRCGNSNPCAEHEDISSGT